jgi:hypothetical protein
VWVCRIIPLCASAAQDPLEGLVLLTVLAYGRVAKIDEAVQAGVRVVLPNLLDNVRISLASARLSGVHRAPVVFEVGGCGAEHFRAVIPVPHTPVALLAQKRAHFACLVVVVYV